MELCRKLNALKEKHRLTNQAISDLSHVPLGTVNNIFAGTTREPSFNTVCAIVTAMGESVDEFYTGTPPQHRADTKSPMPTCSACAMRFSDEVKAISQRAIEGVYARDTYKLLARNQRFWRILSFSLFAGVFALLCVWLVWDINHPASGLIQHAANMASSI